MTMTFPVKKINKLAVYYSSHVSFTLAQDHFKDVPYGGMDIELELSYFPEIIEAFKNIIKV